VSVFCCDDEFTELRNTDCVTCRGSRNMKATLLLPSKEDFFFLLCFCLAAACAETRLLHSIKRNTKRNPYGGTCQSTAKN